MSGVSGDPPHCDVFVHTSRGPYGQRARETIDPGAGGALSQRVNSWYTVVVPAKVVPDMVSPRLSCAHTRVLPSHWLVPRGHSADSSFAQHEGTSVSGLLSSVCFGFLVRLYMFLNNHYPAILFFFPALYLDSCI